VERYVQVMEEESVNSGRKKQRRVLGRVILSKQFVLWGLGVVSREQRRCFLLCTSVFRQQNSVNKQECTWDILFHL